MTTCPDCGTPQHAAVLSAAERKHDWRVHPADCPARQEGADSCDTGEHFSTRDDPGRPGFALIGLQDSSTEGEAR